jgi:hypothetical protein
MVDPIIWPYLPAIDGSIQSSCSSPAVDMSDDVDETVLLETVVRLRLRLALLRRRIDASYQLVLTLPASAASGEEAEFAPRVLVDASLYPEWRGESVIVWHRRNGADAWAVQLKCPHASISLAESDIEDFTAKHLSTEGPCIACPAHVIHQIQPLAHSPVAERCISRPVCAFSDVYF